MKEPRETLMVAKPVDALDRIPSTAHGWSGQHAARPLNGAIRLPDDSLERPTPPAAAPREDGLPAAEPAAAPKPNGAVHERGPTKRIRSSREGLSLAQVIESEVVPRLVLAGRAAACEAETPGRDAVAPGPEDVVALVGLVIADDAAASHAYVESLRTRGIPLERLYLDLFAVVARRLGQLWMEDLCSFADVTVGLVRLQGLVREYSPAFMPSVEGRDPRRSALLIPVPGEQHTFGLAMVAEFFLRAGWEVHSDPMISFEELSSTVRNRWFAVAGISVGNDDRLDGVAALIRLVRRDPRNPGIGVMVGGRVFAEKPELAGLVGADATATDGRQAALQAETLLALLARRN
jgi:MerR family transcriptional regulator, light-induced transcriptional regulator